MSKISAGLIKEIKRLANGTFDDQLKCSKLLGEKIFPYGKPKSGVNELVIQEILPTIIKFMQSDNHVLQKEGANCITCITNAPDKANTQHIIDAGVIGKLINFLSSTNSDVLISTLDAFINFAYYFPEKVVEDEVLKPMIQCLKSEKKKVIYQAARFMYYISVQSQENLLPSDERIDAIFKAGGVKPLVDILESNNDATIKYVLRILINIASLNYEYCQRVLNLDGLKSFKKLCDRLFVTKKKPDHSTQDHLKILEERKAIRLLAIRLIKNVTSYGEALVDMVIQEDFIPIILQKNKDGPFSIAGVSGKNPEIKIEFINFIDNVISAKPDFISTLVQDHDFFSFCYNNLVSTNADLLISSLTAICNIVEKFEDQDITRQKIRECGGKTKLANLRKHKNEEIRRLSTMLYQFVFDLKSVAIAEVSGEGNRQEAELIEKDTDSSSDDDDDSDNDQNNDVDDHPRSCSPIISNVLAAPTESNQHDNSGQRSFVGDDTVAVDDGSSRLNPKRELFSPPLMPTTSSSRQSPDLPVASASTMNETDQDEMKPSLAGRLANRSRRTSTHSHAVHEASSTNDGNIRNNHSGRPSAGNSETAATADENIRNDIKPLKQSPTDDDTSAIAPALPVASASTNNGTIPNDNPSRKPSPLLQPVINFVRPNQVTPSAAANNDIIRDEIIKYWKPHGSIIDQYCEKLGIQFNRKDYDAFIPKITFDQITSNSKPDKCFTAKNDKSGFGCLSILFSGNEDGADKICKEINKTFIDSMNTFDKEKIKEVTCSEVMLAEHLETIAAWLKCRILVYCNGWKKYGNWETEDQMIPLFVLEKKEDGYQIVLDLKNNV